MTKPASRVYPKYTSSQTPPFADSPSYEKRNGDF
jgi:hypothetical protein